MSKIRGLLSVVLVLCMVVSIGSVIAAEGDPLSFWVFQSDKPFEFLSDIVNRYNEATGENLSVVTESIPSDQYNGTKLTVAFAADEGPDIFLVSPGTMGKYVSSGIAYPLNDYFTDEMIADFNKSAIDGVTVNGSIYAVPMEVDLYGLYYDIDVFKEAGLEPPTTWNELIDCAVALTTDTRCGITFEAVKGAYQACTWYPFLWQCGGNIFNADNTASAINSPEVIKALSFWRELVSLGVANVAPSRTTGAIGILAEGETAMQICGTWAVAGLENTYADKNIGLVPLPIPDENGIVASVAGGWKLMVNARGSNPDAAAKFVTWAYGESIDVPLEWCTVQKFTYSPRASVVAADTGIYQKGLRSVFTNQIYGTEIPELRMPAEASMIVQDMIQSAVFDLNRSVEDVVKEADEQMTEFIDGYDGFI